MDSLTVLLAAVVSSDFVAPYYSSLQGRTFVSSSRMGLSLRSPRRFILGIVPAVHWRLRGRDGTLDTVRKRWPLLLVDVDVQGSSAWFDRV
jgi:hypothetical protein